MADGKGTSIATTQYVSLNGQSLPGGSVNISREALLSEQHSSNKTAPNATVAGQSFHPSEREALWRSNAPQVAAVPPAAPVSDPVPQIAGVEELKKERATLEHRLFIAERFSGGIRKNIETQEQSWFSSNKQIEADKELLRAQLKRIEEIREQLRVSAEKMREIEALNAAARERGRLSEEEAKRAAKLREEAAQALANKDSLNRAAVKANLERSAKIQDEQLRKIEKLDKVVKGLESTVHAAEAAKNGVVKVASVVYEKAPGALASACDWATTTENWRSVGSATLDILGTCVSKGGALIGFLYDKAVDKRTWIGLGNALCTAGSALKSLGWKALTDPAGALEMLKNGGLAALSFGRSLIKDLGLEDIAVGVWNIGKGMWQLGVGLAAIPLQCLVDLGKVLTGRMSLGDLARNAFNNSLTLLGNVGSSFIEGLRCIKGGVMLLGEISGITDLLMTCKYALEGNWAMAAMHGSMALLSIGSIALTIATAGAASGAVLGAMAMRHGLKKSFMAGLGVAAKRVLKHGGEEIAEKALKRCGTKLGSAACELAADRAAARTVKTLGKAVAKRGERALSQESVEQAAKRAMRSEAKSLIRHSGLAKQIRKATYDFGEDIAKKSTRQLRKTLQQSYGIQDKKVAGYVASELKRGLQSGIAKRRARKDFCRELTESASSKLTKRFEKEMEQSFKTRLGKSLRGELPDSYSQALSKGVKGQAERLGKEFHELADEFVEAGWKGAREGLERAVKRCVRKAVTAAVKQLVKRFRKPIYHFSDHNREVRLLKGAWALAEGAKKGYLHRAHLAAKAESSAHKSLAQIQRKVIRERTLGGDARVTYRRLDDGRWERISSELINMNDVKPPSTKAA